MIMDLDINYPVANGENRSGPSGAQSSDPEREAVCGALYREIEVLIPRLRRFARALTHNTVAADDLVQETLRRALGKIHLWQNGTDLRAWLFTILHHQHINETRRLARESGRVELSAGHQPVEPNQAQLLELRDLKRAIDQLPEQQRAAILLVGVGEMEYEEAASLLNLPIGTVRSRVSRGRAALRILTDRLPRRGSPRPGSSKFQGIAGDRTPSRVAARCQ
jgi:RNA polymerase sigma-70 factor (ECF subfamily)